VELRQLEPRADRPGQGRLARRKLFPLVPGDSHEFIPIPDQPKTVSYP